MLGCAFLPSEAFLPCAFFEETRDRCLEKRTRAYSEEHDAQKGIEVEER